MSDSDWIELARTDAIADGESIEVVAAGRMVAIFNVDGEFFALDGICPHQGGPLGQGELEGCVLTCPWHGWQYELATGIQTINRQPLQETFETREVDGRIQVLIPK